MTETKSVILDLPNRSIFCFANFVSSTLKNAVLLFLASLKFAKSCASAWNSPIKNLYIFECSTLFPRLTTAHRNQSDGSLNLVVPKSKDSQPLVPRWKYLWGSEGVSSESGPVCWYLCIIQVCPFCCRLDSWTMQASWWWTPGKFGSGSI